MNEEFDCEEGFQRAADSASAEVQLAIEILRLMQPVHEPSNLGPVQVPDRFPSYTKWVLDPSHRSLLEE